jgi:hypothetical protein
MGKVVMSTELVESTFYATAFYGGDKRGLCCQITDKNGVYVQLTAAEMKDLIYYWELYINGYI